MLLPQEIIRKKRNGEVLEAADLKNFFTGFLAQEVADYQVSAMLMAITLKGMTADETVELTRVMRDSGKVLSWGYPRATVVDKHSTGGVGDKTSMIVLPLAALEGLRVPMTAGRGLGHTGGTLDKLEAVGWNVQLSPQKIDQLVSEFGGAFMGQTEEIAPLDRRLYALRDVTATVESIPLIVGSILSKKLAEGLGGLVMDVKFGSGAFMREFSQAKALASELIRVGQGLGLKVRCALTSMNSPLGDKAGNALEIHECLEVLRGSGPEDTKELTLDLVTAMVRLAFPERSEQDVRKSLLGHLESGRAYERFLKLGAAQGANVKWLEDPAQLLQAKFKIPVLKKDGSKEGNVVQSCDVRQLGLAVLELGGGRRLLSDRIDPWVGLAGLKRVGATIAPGEPVAVVHANDREVGERVAALVSQAYSMGTSLVHDALVAEWL